jgi:HD-like signal output (HDOD) protein
MRTTPCDPVTAPADDRLRRVLSKIDIRAFPQPSRVGLEFLRVSQQADCDSQKLAAILGADVAITTELLRISNSAYFGFAGRIKAVPHAITVLGLRAVRQLVLCLSVRSAFNSENLYGLEMSRRASSTGCCRTSGFQPWRGCIPSGWVAGPRC